MIFKDTTKLVSGCVHPNVVKGTFLKLTLRAFNCNRCGFEYRGNFDVVTMYYGHDYDREWGKEDNKGGHLFGYKSALYYIIGGMLCANCNRLINSIYLPCGSEDFFPPLARVHYGDNNENLIFSN